MQDFFWSIDLAIFKFINQTLSFESLDRITPILTNLDHHPWFRVTFPLIIMFFFIRKYKRIGFTYFLFLLLSVGVSDFIGGKIKKVVLRPRPFQVEETQTIVKAEAGENRSFYSNHASNNFTAATYLTAFFPGGQIYFFAVASIIALTRVHVGVHYPSDIFVGALIGLMWGFIFSRGIKWMMLKVKEKTT